MYFCQKRLPSYKWGFKPGIVVHNGNYIAKQAFAQCGDTAIMNGCEDSINRLVVERDWMARARTLALVGMAGSGKTVCAAHLASLGYFQFRFGSIIVNEVARRGWPINPENERVVREELRADGMDAIARRALPLLKEALASHACIVIDGLYSFSEYKFLREQLGEDMVVVAIVAERGLRYSRLAARSERPLTAQEAQQRDWQEIERIEKGGPIAIADYTLLNNATPEELLQALEALLMRLEFHP